MAFESVQKSVSDIQSILAEMLEQEDFKGIKLTLDGILLNGLGKLHAIKTFEINMNINDGLHNGTNKNEPEQLVRVTTTQGNKSINVKDKVDMLLVLRLEDDGSFKLVYYKSGKLAWDKAREMKGKNTKKISLKDLRALQEEEQ